MSLQENILLFRERGKCFLPPHNSEQPLPRNGNIFIGSFGSYIFGMLWLSINNTQIPLKQN